MERTVITFRGNFQKDKNVRIWRYKGSDGLKSLHSSIKKQTLDLDYNEDQIFELDGDLINGEDDSLIE
jgi:ubiquitin carboxyl-terminal hydrolase 4/11/15